MGTQSGHPWWTLGNGLIDDLPALAVDARCEAAVIGAGITGNLVAHALAEAGMDAW